MIDSAGDLIEPLLRVIGKIIGWTIRLVAEALFEALPDIFGSIFNYYTGSMARRGWPGWVYVPIALLLTPLTLIAPLIGLGSAGFLILSALP